MSLNRPKKKKWIPGVDMSEFSGRSWRYLQDMWPAEVRLSDEAWKIMSVVTPAWLSTVNFMKATLNMKRAFHLRDFFILCWIQRCEEARENTVVDALTAMKGMNIGKTLWNTRKSALTKLGLIENFPSEKNIRLYRVTAMGKIVIKHFLNNVEQAHQDIKTWMANEPEGTADRIDSYLKQYCFDWKDIISSESGSPRDSSTPQEDFPT